LFEQTLSKTLSNPNLNPVHMAFNKSSESASGEGSALQVRRSSALPGALPAFGPALPGTRFETLPPLAISTGLFKF